MEAALRTVLKDALGEYIKKESLNKTDFSSFPLVLRDLQLNEKKVQEEFDELHESAIQLTCGKIGSIKVTPSWMGTIEVLATNIELSLSFSPTQALKNGMKPKEVDDGYYDVVAPPVPPPNCPPRFCCAHDTSAKRVKGEPVTKECQYCGVTLTSSYEGFKLCPPCSEKEQKCMICCSPAPKPTDVTVPPPSCPHRAHDNSDKPGQTGGQGKQGNLPPPPPRADVPSHQTRGDVAAQVDTSRQSRMQSRSSVPNERMQSMQVPPPQNDAQVFHTQLPPPQSHRPGSRSQPPRAPWEQNRGSMSARPFGQGQVARNDQDEGFAGFLRFVAADIWKTCHSDNRARPLAEERGFGPPPALSPHNTRRGGA